LVCTFFLLSNQKKNIENPLDSTNCPKKKKKILKNCILLKLTQTIKEKDIYGFEEICSDILEF
jgi:hypothetical protein